MKNKKQLLEVLSKEIKLFEEEQKRNISYTALVLSTTDHNKLISALGDKVPTEWDKVAHHVTINMGRWKGNPELVGQTFPIEVVGFAKDALVAAVRVNVNPEFGIKKPHITVAVNRQAGGKPVMSNNLDFAAAEPINISLQGKFVEVAQGENKFAEDYI